MLSAVAHFIKRAAMSCWDAYWRFTYNDGWAIASHIALSALLALFPFLIFVTALASFIGTRELADQVVSLMFDAWPERVVMPIQAEVHNVLTGQRRDLLTIGAALMLWFSSSGVEALRIGLNRAYGVAETRWWYYTRTRSIFFVILGAGGLLALAFFIVLTPDFFRGVVSILPKFKVEIEDIRDQVFASRYMITTTTLILALIAAHLWLPAGRRRFMEVLPGIIVTFLLWIVAAIAFGWYLSAYTNYATTYAGFASVLIALIFLYFISVIFILGGELNAAWKRSGEVITDPGHPTLLPIDQTQSKV